MEFSADQARFRQWQAEWTKSLDRSFDENGHLSTKAIGLLETKLQEEVHSGYVRLCRTWPDGLSAVLAALELGENDAVFLPCVGSAEILRPILQTGAEAVFCDIHPRTFTLDVLSLQKAIRQVMYEAKKRARVVLSIDTFGLPCDYPALEKICETYGLFLVEISPDGLGGSLRRQEIPGFGTAGILSFSPRTTVPAFGMGRRFLRMMKNSCRRFLAGWGRAMMKWKRTLPTLP